MDLSGTINFVNNLLIKANKLSSNICEFKSRSAIFNFVYPILDKRIRDNLYGEDNSENINEYLMASDQDYYIACAEYSNILGNGFFQMSDHDVEILNVYVENDVLKQFDVLFTCKAKPILNRKIVHIGDRGSGKTALQNYWLKKNLKKLEENKIIWVRCDGFALYRLWLKETNGICISIENAIKNKDYELLEKQTQHLNSKIVSIDDYINVMYLYVFVKHIFLNESEFSKKIYEIVKNNDVFVEISTGRKNWRKTDTISLFAALEELHSFVLKEEKNKKINNYALDHIIKISHHSIALREKRRWINISLVLQGVLFDAGYWTLKVIDGIDNCHINDGRRGYLYYKAMLAQLFEIITSSPKEQELILVSMRERSFIDLTSLPPIYDERRSKLPCAIRHSPSVFCDILDKRIKYYTEIQEKQSNISSNLFVKIMLKILKNSACTNNNFYHNNARVFLHNTVSLNAQIYYRMKQLGSIDDEKINSLVDTYRVRNQYLNGRFYLSTSTQWPYINMEPGAAWINIFYFSLDSYGCRSKNEWIGLCKTRILQLLCNYEISETNIVSLLNKSLGYDTNYILTCCDDLRAYGMVDTRVAPSPYLAISNKGRDVLQTVYSNIDCLYYFSLDTPLPQFYVDNSLLNSHSNKFHSKTHYSFAAVTSAIYFIAFIKMIDNIEKNKFNNNRCLIKEFNVDGSKFLRLPFDNNDVRKNLQSSFETLLYTAEQTDLDNICKTLTKYFSIFLK